MTENQNYGNNNMLQAVPNSTAALVLGIVAIVGCIFYGIVGLVCGIIGLVLANKGIAQYNADPQAYTKSSFNNIKAGRVCSIIGICLSALYIILLIAGISMITSNPDIFDKYR